MRKNSIRMIISILICLLMITACYQQVPVPVPVPVPDGGGNHQPSDDEDSSEPETITSEYVEIGSAADGTTTISVENAPAAAESVSHTTKVVFPGEAILGNNAQLAVKSYSIDNSDKFTGTVPSKAVVGVLDISLKVDGKETASFNNKSATVTTYIAEGLKNVDVIYEGASIKKAEDDITYNSGTGELIFKTSHFSEFIVEADCVVAYIPEENKAYETLSEAIDDAKTGASVIMLRDASGKGLSSKDGTNTRNSLTIDFAGHTYTMMDPAVGSTGTETQAMHWGTSLGAITIKNGTFKVAEDTSRVKMAMQNYINFTAENMTFDFSAIPVNKYGENEFKEGSGYEEFNGLEVPMFNNNRDGVMYLKECSIIMPSESTKGISAGGKYVALENTAIDGYVCLLADTCQLFVSGTTKLKGVVAYFEGDKISCTEQADGTKIYTLATE